MHARSMFLVLPLVPVKNVIVLVGSTTDRDGLAGMGTGWDEGFHPFLFFNSNRPRGCRVHPDCRTL